MALGVTNLVGFGASRAAGGGAGEYSINTEGTDGGLELLSVSSFGTGNFTVEAWFYATSLANTWNFITGHGNQAGGGALYAKSDGSVVFYEGGTRAASATSAISANTWYHAAAVRNSGTLKLYIDGSEVDSVAYTTNLTVTDYYIGENRVSTEEFQGYIYRPHGLTTAKYTTSFTPAVDYTSEASTQYLVTTDGATFTDSEGNTITNNGATHELAAPT